MKSIVRFVQGRVTRDVPEMLEKLIERRDTGGYEILIVNSCQLHE